MTDDEKISVLSDFLAVMRNRGNTSAEGEVRRSEINRKKALVRSLVIEARCFKRFTISPPPAVGGLVMSAIDAFDMLFDPPYGRPLDNMVIDMVEEAIGKIESGYFKQAEEKAAAATTTAIRTGYAFVAMSINPDDRSLEDVLDAIKHAASECGITAERIDEQNRSEKITDRIVEALKVAEFVIVDLTGARPNVYWEAGFAHALGKVPIYVAKKDTRLEFDIRDYPVIFYNTFGDLRAGLKERLHSISASRA